jgi:hypothetical protein
VCGLEGVKPPFAASNRAEAAACYTLDGVVSAKRAFLVRSSSFRSDRANKFVNEFATDRLRALDRSRGYFWIQVRVRLSDLFRGHRWGRVGQFDSVVDKFSFQAMYFHDDSFLG